MPSASATSSPKILLPTFFAFASAYLLSCLLRSINAVVAPDLMRDLGLLPGSLGLVTGAYLFAAAAIQLPAGVVLDRYGARRVESALLMLAAVGCITFATADSLPAIIAARGLIGAGFAVCLMAPLSSFARLHDAAGQASLGAWTMFAGGLGTLMAATPIEWALSFLPWRALFACLAAVISCVALWLWIQIPDALAPASKTTVRQQVRIMRSVMLHRRFLWLAPLCFTGVGIFFSVQGLWSIAWLMEVEGCDRASAAGHLSVMGVFAVAGHLVIAFSTRHLARRGVLVRHILAAGVALNLLALGAIAAQVPGTYGWFAIYGLGGAINILPFTLLNEGLPKELSGRATTALNLVIFSGGFFYQWGTGAFVELAAESLGGNRGAALRGGFFLMLLSYAAAIIWFLYGWRRNSSGTSSPDPQSSATAAQPGVRNS
jgi:predicted MFS family arabinose efflux permease